jgi:DNA-directed RNA polymerase subunit M/transcription elongation factor TFIIS
LTQTAGKPQKKNGEGKNKEYSIKWFGKNCTIEYKGEIKDRGFLKWVPFISILGETAVRITAWSSVIIGFFGIYILPQGLSDVLFILLGCLLFCVFYCGMFLFPYTNYIKATKCKKCHKVYAYEEMENPDIKEVSTEDTYTVTITRHWKCKYCGYIDNTESPENIDTHKGKKKKPKRIFCEKCGKSGVYPEYKTPDVRSDEFAFTRIRFYKCEQCKYINIAVEEASRGENSTWESKGSDPRL